MSRDYADGALCAVVALAAAGLGAGSVGYVGYYVAAGLGADENTAWVVAIACGMTLQGPVATASLALAGHFLAPFRYVLDWATKKGWRGALDDEEA